jgi:hypothetical protein
MAAGWPTKVTYANGDVYSASDVNDTNGTLNYIDPTSATDGQVLTRDAASGGKVKWAAPSAGAPIVAGKNGLINGGFQFWQRGTSSSGNAYLADRWYSALISGTGTFAQESTVVPSGSVYSQKFTVTAIAQPALYQAIETQNAIRFAGQNVTVSAKVAASTSTGFTTDVQYSTATDNGVTGTWTSITATSGGTATATSTTFVSISGVYAIPSTAKSLRVRLFTTSTVAVSAVVYFGQVQIEQGTTATNFSNAMGTVSGELAACQRYYIRYVGTGVNSIFSTNGYSWATTNAGLTFAVPVTMRVLPTAIEYSTLKISDQVNYNLAVSALTLDSSGQGTPFLVAATATNATGATVNRFASLNANASASAYVAFSSEL